MFEGFVCLVRRIKEKRAQVIKVLFLLATQADVEQALAAGFARKVYEVRELLS